jgi:hypothetical protein
MPYIGQAPTQSAFVTDTFNGNGSTTAFTMSVAPAGTTSVLVAVSGVLQDPSTYSVSGTTLTFSAAPPSGTGNISARYLGIPASGVTTTAYRTVTEFTATAGQTTFTPPSYTAGFINVYRNGARLGSADYTATNGTTVVLASGATAGDLVTIESYYVSSVLNAIPNTGGTIGGSLIVTGNVGIGSSSPTCKLDVGTGYINSAGFKYATGGPVAIFSGCLTAASVSTIIGAGAGYVFLQIPNARYINSDSSVFTINSTGNGGLTINKSGWISISFTQDVRCNSTGSYVNTALYVNGAGSRNQLMAPNATGSTGWGSFVFNYNYYATAGDVLTINLSGGGGITSLDTPDYSYFNVLWIGGA